MRSANEIAALRNLETRLRTHYQTLVDIGCRMTELNAMIAENAELCTAIESTDVGREQLVQLFAQTNEHFDNVRQLYVQVDRTMSVLECAVTVANSAVAHCLVLIDMEQRFDRMQAHAVFPPVDYQKDVTKPVDPPIVPSRFSAIIHVKSQIEQHRDMGSLMFERLNNTMNDCIVRRNIVAMRLRAMTAEIATRVANGN